MLFRSDFASVTAIPVSARDGDNVASRSKRTPWYDGPTLLSFLEAVDTSERRDEAPVRFPVQWVNRPDDSFRGFAGTVASGRLAVGDPVVVVGSGQSTRVDRIVTFDGDLECAVAGHSITLTLSDDVDVARDELLVDPRHRPIQARRCPPLRDLRW